MNRGASLAIIAYLVWGFAPLYWIQLSAVSAGDIVAHRILWSVPLLGVVLWLTGRFGEVARLFRNGRSLLTLCVSTTAQLSNWTIFVWAVTHGRATEASLGYFLLPLINMAIGLAFFRETLTRPQWVAFGLAALGMAILVSDKGGLPWVALGVAVSFGLYGALRKGVPIGAVEGLFVETLLLAPLALAWLAMQGGFALVGLTPGEILLLLGAGVITVVPLLCYVVATQTLPFSLIGLIFYLGPSCQLFVAICIFGEPMNPVELFSFGLVWLGLALVALDTLRRYRSVRILEHD